MSADLKIVPATTKDFPPEVVDRVKNENPGVELRQLTADDTEDTFIFKAPTRGEYKRFRKMANDPGQRSEAIEALFWGCLVYPPAQEVRAIMELRPGLADTFGDKLTDWAGAGQEVREKKL